MIAVMLIGLCLMLLSYLDAVDLLSTVMEGAMETTNEAALHSFGTTTEIGTSTAHDDYIYTTNVIATEENQGLNIETKVSYSEYKPTSNDMQFLNIFKQRKDSENPEKKINKYMNSLETIKNNFMETFRKTDWEHALEKNETLGWIEMKKTQKDKLDRLNEFKEFISVYSEGRNAENQLFAEDLERAECAVRVSDDLYKIVEFKIISEELNDSMTKKCEECVKEYSFTLLDHIIEESEYMVNIIKTILEEGEIVLELKKACDFETRFESPYMSKLLDMGFWRYRFSNETRVLETWKSYRRDRNFDDVLHYYVGPGIQILIFVVGLFGNAILLTVFIRHREMRTDANLLIMNLTVGDFLSLLVNVLLAGLIRFYGFWNFGLVLCKIYRYVSHVCIAVNVYSIVVISVQRCILKSPRCGCRNPRNIKNSLIILFVWLMASFPAIPHTVNTVMIGRTCTEKTDGYLSTLTLIDLVVICVIPLIVVAVSSGIFARRVKNGRDSIIEARTINSKILTALIVVFAVCYLPYYVHMYAHLLGFQFHRIVHETLSFVTETLIFGDACLNPIALYIADAKYRRHMNYYLSCRRKRLTADNKCTTTKL